MKYLLIFLLSFNLSAGWDVSSHEPDFLEEEDVNYNANVTFVEGVSGHSASMDIGKLTKVVYEVRVKTGLIGTFAIKMQCSLDGSTWHDVSGASKTGEGMSSHIDVYAEHIRFITTATSGAAATVELHVNVKP